MNDPYHYMWREEISADYPMHTYITKGTDLLGFVRRGTSEIQWFKTPKKSWSPSRRKFRKLGRKEIAAFVKNSDGIHEPFCVIPVDPNRPINILDFAIAA
jgi:hypothetical protein